MEIKVWSGTDVGLRRERNEDSFLVDEGLGLYILADGMGGHRGGEVASLMAVNTIREVVMKEVSNSRRISPRAVLVDAYQEASHRIFDKSHKSGNSELQGMGTTLVTAFYHGGVLYIANVGDSRAYLFSKPYLWQITEDHSLVNEQIRAGMITEKDVPIFAAKNVITRSVGFERDVTCDVIERHLKAGEMVLVCSDGLSGLVTDAKIAEIFMTSPHEEIVTKCIDAAKKNGGDDNVTVLLIEAIADR